MRKNTDNTKYHILQESFKLLLKKNYHEVTMREIVDATGLSKGAFYHHFESKEVLFKEVIDVFYTALTGEIYNDLEYSSLQEFYNNYLERLAGMLVELKKSTDIDAKEINYMGLAFDAMRIVPGYREQIRKAHEEEQRAWEIVIQNAKETGEIETQMTDEQVARVFIYINDGVGMHLILEGRIESIYSEIKSLFDAFYQQIIKR